MKRAALILFTLFLFVVSITGHVFAQEEKIRVKIEVIGGQDLGDVAGKYVNKSISEIKDVEVVDENPAVYIHVIARRLVTNRGRRVGYAVASASSEIIGVADENGNAYALSDYYGLWLETGPDLRDLCEQCVGAVNSGVLNRIRGYRSGQIEP